MLQPSSQGGIGAPDYENGEIILDAVLNESSVSKLPYTIPKNGWLKIITNAYSKMRSNIRSHIYVNGFEIAWAFSGNTGTNTYGLILDEVNFESIWPVRKGDIVTIESLGYGWTEISFLPER